ncbi:MAG: thaumatin family protein [Pseudomonadota bacterium]
MGRRDLINFVPFLCVIACGGASTHEDPGNMSAGAGGTSTAGMSAGAGSGGACEEPLSVVPDLPPFQAPPIDALGAYHVTLHNHCGQTVWPASAPSGGLENSVIDTQLWLPLLPANDRTITVYGGVREIGFWGRTGCSFDQAGNGTCETGECGGLLCPMAFGFPPSATAFDLEGGFQGRYNVGLRVEGGSCGDHECTANLDDCDDASVLENACGKTIACSDICSDSPTCCARPGCDSGGVSHGDSGDDLVVTFCP